MSESVPAPTTTWTIAPRDVSRAFAGGARVATSLLFRTSGPADEITARSKALGRTAVREKLRTSIDANDPKIALFLKLQTESAALSLEGRRIAAKLTTLRASREETLLAAVPGFSGQVVQLDAQIAEMQAKADKSAAALAAIAEATMAARNDAIGTLGALAMAVTASEHAGFRRRREELVAGLPAIIGATLTEMASLERAILLDAFLPSEIGALLDELATATGVPSVGDQKKDEPATTLGALPAARAAKVTERVAKP